MSKYFSDRCPSSYKIYFENGKVFEFDAVKSSEWKIQRLKNSFSFETLEMDLDFLKTVSKDVLVAKIEEVQEIVDMNSFEKYQLTLTFLTGGEITVKRKISSNGESPSLSISWNSNTIFDTKVSKI